MALVIAYGIISLLEWMLLLVVIPIAQRLADFDLPPAFEMAWKLLLIVIIQNGVGWCAYEISQLWFVELLAGGLAFWIGMWRVFRLDVFGAVVIMVISSLAQRFIFLLIATLGLF